MKIRHLLLTIVILGLGTAALAASPIAMPEGVSKINNAEIPIMADKAFGDATDLKAATIAAAPRILIFSLRNIAL